MCTAAHLEMGSQLLCLTIWFEYKNKSQTGLNNTLVMSCSVHCLFSVNINNIFTAFFLACLSLNDVISTISDKTEYYN